MCLLIWHNEGYNVYAYVGIMKILLTDVHFTQVASILGWLGAATVTIILSFLHRRVFMSATTLIYISAVLLPILGFFISYGIAMLFCRVSELFILRPPSFADLRLEHTAVFDAVCSSSKLNERPLSFIMTWHIRIKYKNRQKLQQCQWTIVIFYYFWFVCHIISDVVTVFIDIFC